MRKTVVMIPTYNERENIGRLIETILALEVPEHELHVLVVDDNSPDGTSAIVKGLADQSERVHLMTRTTERGRGSAGIAGFKQALSMGADYAVEMDADFSHDPKYLPHLIAAADRGADVVLGSRFVDGGADTDRGPYRRAVTLAAGAYLRTVLNLKVRDVSSGYRCFKRGVLERIELDRLISTGPSIVFEILHRCSLLAVKIVEVPIVFIDRREGTTKLSFKILMKAFGMALKFRLRAVRSVAS